MKNEQVDNYIADCAPFAQPILSHLRELIHEAIPEIEEQIKWRMPSFEVDGKIVCSIAGFKKHCVLRFFKGIHMNDPENILLQIGKTEMCHIGNIQKLDELPENSTLLLYLKTAMQAVTS